MGSRGGGGWLGAGLAGTSKKTPKNPKSSFQPELGGEKPKTTQTCIFGCFWPPFFKKNYSAFCAVFLFIRSKPALPGWPKMLHLNRPTTIASVQPPTSQTAPSQHCHPYCFSATACAQPCQHTSQPTVDASLHPHWKEATAHSHHTPPAPPPPPHSASQPASTTQCGHLSSPTHFTLIGKEGAQKL